MEIKITIVDDAEKDILKLKELLCSYFHDDSITFHTYTNSLSLDDSINDDVYFLDIDMPNKDGYHLAKEIYDRQPTAKIIFCTMHDDFVYTSFQFNPFYFIRKSHLKEDTEYAIKKFKQQFNKNYLIVTTEHINKKIPLSNIMYIESQRNYTYIYQFDGEEYIKARISLTTIQKSLNSDFIKIAKGIIVNAKYILSIKSNNIIMKNNVTFTISRYLKNDVIHQYNQFIIGE